MVDPYYKSALWRRLCAAVSRRSGGRCEAPGCTSPGKVVDHVISRRSGGTDTLDNLRHLCRTHDNEIKEDSNGKRRSDGKLKPSARCDRDGLPIDPGHPFYGNDIKGVAGSNIKADMGRGPARARSRSKFGGR